MVSNSRKKYILGKIHTKLYSIQYYDDVTVTYSTSKLQSTQTLVAEAKEK